MKNLLASAFVMIAILSAPALQADEIHDAALAGDLAKVKALVEKDSALLNAKGRNEKAPIHWAAQGGHLDVVAFLVEKGAPVDARNIAKETPLVYAVGLGHLDVAKFLLAKGADARALPANGHSLLSIALGAGWAEMARLLVEKGADVQEKQRDGRTLLHEAALGGSTEAVKMLLEKGLPAAVRTDAGETPILFAAMAGNFDSVRLLAAKGADPLARLPDGRTLLHQAILSGSPEFVKWALDKGIPVDAKTEAGDTPLLYAASNGPDEAAAILIGRGADVNVRNALGEWPLFLAVKFGRKDVAARLLNAGAGPDGAETESGRTVLHMAAAKGFGEICSRLLAKGASIDPADRRGETALTLAKRYGNEAVAAALVLKGATTGTAPVRPEPDAGLSRPLAEGQAVIWYLGHSGWAVLTRSRLLIFDYAKAGASPDEPGLANGTISPAELKGLPVTVFVSHAHEDHYSPVIWQWRKSIPDISYVLGFRPREKEVYALFKPRERAELNGLEITPIESNDTGQGFFVKSDGVSIFFPGDHANRRRDFSGPFKREIDFLADAGLKADILFAPVSGCGFGDLLSVKKGVFYTIDRLSARAVFPMHAGGGENTYAAFARDARNAGYDQPMCVAGMAGDRFAVTPGEVKGAFAFPRNDSEKTTCPDCVR